MLKISAPLARALLAACLYLACATAPFADAVFPFTSAVQSVIPLGEIRVNAPTDALTVRSNLIHGITGGNAALVAPSMATYDNAFGADPQSYFGRMPSFAKWLYFTWAPGSYYGSVNSRVYFASFFADATCLIVYNAGHTQGFFSLVDLAAASGSRDLVRRVVNEAHCDVILHSMPIQGENAQFSVQRGYDVPPYYIHNMLGDLAPYMTGSPLRFFLEDESAAITYALARKSYAKVIVTGISGGGWTTTMMAALDPRITASYAVAGSVPLGLRQLRDWGDWEQFALGNFGVDYPDMYLAGTVDAAGNVTRKAWVFYNTDDECCFDRNAYSGFVYWIKSHAAAHGFVLALRFFSFFGQKHDYSAQVANVIVNDILTGTP